MYIRKMIVPNTFPWGTSAVTLMEKDVRIALQEDLLWVDGQT